MRSPAPLLLVLVVAACTGGGDVGERSTALTHPSFEGLATQSKEAVLEAQVRVLLFPPRMASRTVAMSGDQWMALSSREGELTLSLHATSRAHQRLEEIAPGENVPPPRFAVRESAARSGVNEGIRFVTWVDGQTAYSLEIECYRVLDDARCAEPDFALSLADELVAF